jgi:hypothetical protein
LPIASTGSPPAQLSAKERKFLERSTVAAENTDLERRVLAHEQILQALLAQLSGEDAQFLDRLKDRFASSRRGSHEHDYTDTADYVEQFMHEVMRLRSRKPRRETRKPLLRTSNSANEGQKPELPHGPTVIRGALRGGVWHVTHDDTFYGDYHKLEHAKDAAVALAAQINQSGGRAKIKFGSAGHFEV